MSLKSLSTGLVCGMMLIGQPATAGAHPRRAHNARIVPTATPARASSFYPNDTPGGVTGNLPFNNQIRKLSDPLNANGGGR